MTVQWILLWIVSTKNLIVKLTGSAVEVSQADIESLLFTSPFFCISYSCKSRVVENVYLLLLLLLLLLLFHDCLYDFLVLLLLIHKNITNVRYEDKYMIHVFHIFICLLIFKSNLN